jgi:excisionase family DNA binding protein
MPLPEARPPFEAQIGRSVSIDRASQLLQVSRRTIYYWIRDGRLRTLRTLGGSQRILRESVQQAWADRI